MKGKELLNLLALFSLFSCASPQPSSSSLIPSSEATSSQPSSSEESPEKDDRGFIKLPSGYLKKESRLHSFGADVTSKTKATNLRLFLGDEEVPVYGVYVNQTHKWDPKASGRDLSAVAEVSLKEGAKFTLQSTWVVSGRCKALPSASNIELDFDETYRAINFEITKPGDYMFEYRGGRALHLFVYPYEGQSQYNESNSLYFGPGINSKDNDPRLRNNSTITLSSNQVVYLAEGAFVEGAFISNNTTGVKILGKGFIDGSVFERDASKGSRFIPFDFTDCHDFELYDFAVLDPAGWCFNLYFCHDFSLKRVKIISSRSNGDGISLQSCKNALVDGCFVRSYDDSIVVKNYPRWNNRSIEGETENIEVRNCKIYNDLAQCLEVGYETVGTKMEGIYFHDTTILGAYHKAVLSIHNGNNANIKNVRFEDIVIENLQTGLGDGNPYLIDFSVAYSPTWSDQHKVTSLGSIDGVKVKNVNVLSGKTDTKIIITGSMETRSAYPKIAHEINNVELENIVILGKKIDSTYPGFILDYAHNISLDGVKLD